AEGVSAVFKLGLKGVIDGIEYEIIGRIRYQEEEEYELSTWDEWLAVNTADGSYHWFVEEDGAIFLYGDYVPQSINLEAANNTFEFDGRSITKNRGFVARIVFHEGELTWRPELGEPMTVYDFKNGGTYFTIEQSEGEVSISSGKKLAYKAVLQAFRKDEYLEQYESTIKARKSYRNKAWLYLAMSVIACGFIVRGCASGTRVEGVTNNRLVITDNAKMTEQGQGTVYNSEVLYGPVTLDDPENLYEFSITADQSVQQLSREWQSFRVMLIAEDRLKALAPTIDREHAKAVNDALDDIEFQPDPVESYVFQGDFWDEDGTDSEGYWHESDTSLSKSFVMQDPGNYYVYLSLFSEKPRKTESVSVGLSRGMKSSLYFPIILGVLGVLMLYNRAKSRKYNELPFPVDG
ncbi:MAG: DUF4178 domain-containing protein, partial [Spirochaetes bacterium]